MCPNSEQKEIQLMLKQLLIFFMLLMFITADDKVNVVCNSVANKKRLKKLSLWHRSVWGPCRPEEFSSCGLLAHYFLSNIGPVTASSYTSKTAASADQSKHSLLTHQSQTLSYKKRRKATKLIKLASDGASMKLTPPPQPTSPLSDAAFKSHVRCFHPSQKNDTAACLPFFFFSGIDSSICKNRVVPAGTRHVIGPSACSGTRTHHVPGTSVNLAWPNPWFCCFLYQCGDDGMSGIYFQETKTVPGN